MGFLWLWMLFVVVCGLLIAVASLVTEHGLWACGLRSCSVWLSSCSSWAVKHRLSRGARAQLLLGMWDLPGSGVKSTSPAMAGGFFTTEPRGEPPFRFDEVLTEEMNPTVKVIESSHMYPHLLKVTILGLILYS